MAFLNLIATISVFGTAELCSRRLRLGKDQFFAPDKIMTEQEFDDYIKQGKKLWILDDIVLDLSEFASKHPGGSFVINHSIGKDISKFFYGGYAMDSNSPSLPNKAITWNHSNTARKIVNQLAVAKFVKSKTPVFSAKISDQVSLNTHTTTFTLKCE